MFSARQAFVQIARTMGWSQQAKLLASDAASSDRFGYSIAISADGNTVAVGAYFESTAPNNYNGAAYIFTRSGTVWTEQAKLLASDSNFDDQFGSSISISSNGNTVAVGAFGKNGNRGAAYIFTRSGTVWTQQAKLVASDAAISDQFGWSIAISDAGDTVAVGAPGESTAPNTGNGAAYIFTRSGTAWTQQTKIVTGYRANYVSFGRSIALSGDGVTMAAGAPFENTAPNTYNGVAYIYTRSGSTWSYQERFLVSDRANSDYFGSSIAIDADGNTVAVGASNKTGVGAAYVFTRGEFFWTQQAKLLAADAATSDQFGSSIAISANGDTVTVGAQQESTAPNTNNGAAYVFTRSGTVWTQQAKLLAADAASNDQFGSVIDIAANGDTVAVGAWRENTAPLTLNGAAYIFTIPI